MDKQPPRVLRVSEVVKRTGLCKSTVYARIRAGDFPKPVPLGKGRAVGFLEHEVDQWFAHIQLQQEDEAAAAHAVLAIARARGRSYLRYTYLRFANQPQQAQAEVLGSAAAGGQVLPHREGVANA